MRLRKLRMMLKGARMTHLRSPDCGRSDARDRSATGFAVALRRSAKRITLAWLAMLAAATVCPAGELAVSVVDRSGRAVADVVVTAAPAEQRAPLPASAPATAVMDQRDRAFVPRVLAVAVGTSVEFPNNDSVSHQVYSFSAAKRFQLPLYKGARHPPVTFDREGLVVLGCNIHDEMAGYIYVTAAPFFGTTDPAGTLRLPNLPAGEYRVTLWSPLIADPPSTLVRTVHVDAREPAASRVQLTRDLRARPEPRPRRGDWEY
jgi:plastocyanin